jgi:glycosyltransferase involved in cell wall biosynthesis
MTVVPTFSVCVPTRNQARYLREALESVLTQELGDFELVVYDDASTDGTQAVLEAIVDPRLRLRRHRNMRPLGIAATRDACVRVARGRYLAWLDSDDAYLPGALTRLCDVLDRHPDVGLVHGAFQLMDADGRRLPDWPPPFEADTVERGADAFGELLLSNYVRTSTTAVRRALYERAGPHALGLSLGEDWEMWLRIACQADVAYLADPLARCRYHPRSSSATARRDGDVLRSETGVVRRAVARVSRSVSERRQYRRRAYAAIAARALLEAGDAFTRGLRRRSLFVALRALRLAPRLATSAAGLLLVANLAAGREYGAYRRSKTLLSRLARELEGTRFGDRVAGRAADDDAWLRSLAEIARIVRTIVPPAAGVVCVDKYDPTLLHLARRNGWHFPDRRLMQDGYPPTSEEAIAHLSELQSRGALYLVVPSASFWWLDFYEGLRRHLESQHERLWSDERCIVYGLAERRHGARSSEGSPRPLLLEPRRGLP